ncbi:hypothetical protein BGZ60DRAFT_531363 [Tricladium varicosporioides]|nr:hypothetical protein BGZ60DRAFT_531363 [Hymenoscyphus varicosporioides]
MLEPDGPHRGELLPLSASFSALVSVMIGHLDLHDGPNTEHCVDNYGEPERGRRTEGPGELLLPKNRSTGNLLAYGQKGTEKARIRFSFDAGSAVAEYDTMSRLVLGILVLSLLNWAEMGA